MFRVDVRFRLRKWVRFGLLATLGILLAGGIASCEKLSSPTPPSATATATTRVDNIQYFFAAANKGATSQEKNLLSLLYQSMLETQDIPNGQYINFFHFVEGKPVTPVYSGEVEQRSIATYDAIRKGFLQDPGDLSNLKMMSSSVVLLGEVLAKVPSNQRVLAHIILDTSLLQADVDALANSWKKVDENEKLLGHLCIVLPESEQNRVSVTIPSSVKNRVQMTSWETRESSCLLSRLPLSK